jgi:hypothetical protein
MLSGKVFRARLGYSDRFVGCELLEAGKQLKNPHDASSLW